jgi:hypothetical protein
MFSSLRKAIFGDPKKFTTNIPYGRFSGDGLFVKSRNLSWLTDPAFVKSYSKGISSGHRWGPELHLEWRVHMILWAASHAMHLEGDFVECGVNTGIFSLAICDYLEFEKSGRKMFLFDTFAGAPESMMKETEKQKRLEENNLYYPDCYELAQKNFSPYPNVHLVRGLVPQSLSTVQIDKVAYLSIDMNIAAPERAAIEHFWPKLASGAIVVLDDYGWRGFEEQHKAMNEFADINAVKIATLPTGQGILIKP